MRNEDPEHERLRLRDYYAGLTEGELQKIASDAPSLTDIAQKTLQEELDRRGLETEPAPSPNPAHETEAEELVTVERFRDLPVALLARGSLESAGIECFLADENMVRMDWFISNFIGGVKLRVRPQDAEAAREILNQPIPDSFDVEAEQKYEQPRCPNCESLEIVFEGIDQKVGYVTAGLLGIPMRFGKHTWKCQACGFEWRESGTT